MSESSGHKAQLQTYFDGVGFERWAAIYGQVPLSRVRRSIRAGHGAMLEQASAWVAESLPTLPQEPTALDAGCGTGLFSLALARRGFAVTAVDIAPQMVGAASEAAVRAGLQDRISFACGDAESLSGRYDLVACFDVLVHYPPELFAPLLKQLAGLASGSLLFTYAPAVPLLSALHWIGGRFPQGQRRQNIRMIPERFVVQTLAEAGMTVRRSARVSHGFYHVTLVEARPTNS